MTLSLSPLTLADRLRFEQALQKTSGIQTSPLAALAFAPHMVWNEHAHYRWTDRGGWFCLFVEYVDGIFMALPPLGPGESAQATISYDQVVEEVFEYMTELNQGSAVTRMENVPEELKGWYERQTYRVRPKDSDYVYFINELAGLQGDRYKSQRAACNRLLRESRPQYEPYQEKDREGCLRLFERWAAQKEENRRHHRAAPDDAVAGCLLKDAAAAHQMVFTHHRALGLLGRVVRIGEMIGGYTFGYERTPHVMCVLVEVADRTMPGMAQYLFREFCREFSQYEWVNTMDDSGLPSLARAKQAYHPCRMEPNYIVTPF